MLDSLKARLKDIEKAIGDTNQSILILQGHKAEVMFQIAQLEAKENQKAAEEAKPEEKLEP